ncbi:glycosyltransferase family 2 protein [Clostridium beijerinckii]|uniref:glycosyltransferase family 2 protein n=1 Tax=Clostridium beijerinckii TaxID=1520 RepID=UPI00047B1258|nr:glycosyltransferase family A protein [Clostridium beijerinckii]
MDEKKYIDGLNEIIKEISNGNCSDDILDEIEEYYKIKPVRLLWFITKAKYMYKAGFSFEDIYNTLEGKITVFDSYCGSNEYLQLCIDLAEIRQDNIDRLRIEYQFNCINYSKGLLRYKNHLLEVNDKLILEQNKYINEKEISIAITNKISEAYFIKSDYILYLIMLLYDNKMPTYNREWVLNIPNMGYLVERIKSTSNDVFIILVSNKAEINEYKIVADILFKLGKKVCFIGVPIDVNIDNLMNISDSLTITLDNIEEYNNMIIFHPIELIYNRSSIGDNREYIIDYICRNYTDNTLATILCNGRLIDELCQRPLLKKQMERLSPFLGEYLEDNMAFGWVGKYMSYISNVYQFDVEAEIQKKSECNFSIVIPARNSSISLRYTLETCLNQRYSGSYEIVLSDNSTNGNTQVYDLYCEINDPRIKYYKTPRDLHLPKSFEFALLKAKGDFIISIGSDDALLPWTLEVLDDVIKKYPEEEIFQWERGFYAWPGFNGGQENQFVIPSKYEKNKYEVYNVDKNDYLAKILNNPKSMYGLPMLYINSGFRRSYMNTLLNKTGRLLDGICQDIYIGVVNISINNHIANIKYPLTIAGMTGASVGAQSNIGATSVNESNNRAKELIKTNNIGGFSTSAIERLMPEVTTDTSSLYNSILRVIARGLFPLEFLDNLLDWKQMFKECFSQLEVTDVLYDKKLHYFRYTAAKHGDEFLKWFDESIYEKAIIPRKIDDKRIEELLKRKTYKEGITESGGEILDASKYGVTNVYEASLLFEELTKL